MASIEIDFEVFKALTSRRATEETTYNAVLRELLGLPATPAMTSGLPMPIRKAWTWKGVTLPDGTRLKAEYKAKAYAAEIVDGRWLQDGKNYGSPSAAAYAIVESGINGWWFWSVKRPEDNDWLPLGKLRPEQKV